MTNPKFDAFCLELLALLDKYDYMMDGTIYGDIAVFDREDAPNALACDISDSTEAGLQSKRLT